MLRGQAEPPIATRFKVVNFRLAVVMWSSSINHTVGTPAVSVTLSASINAKTEAPSSLAPGITVLAPHIGRRKAKAQALAWNIGTTQRTESWVVAPNEFCIAWSTLER